MSGLALLAVLLVDDVGAHVPHDTMIAVSVPPDLAPDEPWDLLAAPHGIPLWERSVDAGRTWSIVQAEPTGDDLVDATRLADGTRVALAADRYWWSRSGGETWQWAPLPAAVRHAGGLVRGDGRVELVLLGGGGVWVGPPGALGLASGASFVALGGGPSAVDADGRAWVSRDGAWARLDVADADLASIASDEALTVVGTRGGEVLRWSDAGWERCGALPEPPAGGAPDVVLLAVEGDRVWAAAAWRGPFRSDDGCATWQETAVPDDPVIGPGGGASGPDETWLDLVVAGDRAVIAGWGGVFATADGGGSWYQGPTVSSAYTRGLSFSSDYAHDGTVLYGTYGAAILAAVAGEPLVQPRDGGFYDTNAQQVLYAADPALADRVYSVEAHVAWGSDDGGATWTLLPLDVDRSAALAVTPDGREVWAFSLDGGQAVLRSLDGGRAWERLDGLVAALGASRGESVALLAGRGGARCVGGLSPLRVRCSDDGGATWRPGLDGEGGGSNVVGWPVEAPTRVIVGDRRRLWRSDDGGRTWAGPAWEGEGEPSFLHAAPDGALLLGSTSGELWRSLDGGRRWERLPFHLTSRLRTVSSRPDPVGIDEHLIGDADGAWVLRGLSGEPTLERWEAPERIDDGGGFMSRATGAVRVEAAAAGMGTMRRLPEAAWVSAWVRGDRVRVIGRADVGDVFEVWIDDALEAVVGDLDTAAEPDGIGVVALIEGLAPGWHDVRVVGRGEDGVEVDAIEGLTPGATLAPPDPSDPASACQGCSGAGRGGEGRGAGALLALAALAGAAAVRRTASPA